MIFWLTNKAQQGAATAALRFPLRPPERRC